jgi:hypothetical protein
MPCQGSWIGAWPASSSLAASAAASLACEPPVRLADHKSLLTRIFAFVLLAVAAYMLFRSLGAIGS